MIAALLFYSLVGGLFSLIGGFFILWKSRFAHKIITTLIAFGAGAFLSAALLDILPEALESTNKPHPVLLATLTGFTAFFILERFIMRFLRSYHGKDVHSDHTESLPFLLILGDSIHNFFDGIVIAIAYVANPLLGLPAALAIAAHEIPQEIGDFSVLLKLGWPKGKIIAINVMQSILTIPGVFIGFYAGQAISAHVPFFLGITAGIFLYIGASDLIPELHHETEHKHFFRVIIPFILSIILIYFLTNLAHSSQ